MVLVNHDDAVILATLCIDLIVFLSAVVLWGVIRRLRGDRIHLVDRGWRDILKENRSSCSESDAGIALPGLQTETTNEAADSLWLITKTLLSTEDLSFSGRVDVTNYFLFLKQMRRMLLLLTVTSAVTMLPYNWLQSDLGRGVFAAFSARTWANNPSNEGLVVFASYNLIAFSIAFYFTEQLGNATDRDRITTSVEALEDIGTTNDFPPLPEDFAAVIEGLQPQILSSEAIEGVFKSLSHKGSGPEVRNAELALDYSELQSALSKHAELTESMENLREAIANEIRKVSKLEEPLFQRRSATAPISKRQTLQTRQREDPLRNIEGADPAGVSALTLIRVDEPEEQMDYLNWVDEGGAAHMRVAGYGRAFHRSKQKQYEDMRAKVESARIEFETLAKRPPSRNVGKAFVVFSSTLYLRQALAFQHRQFYYAWGWRLSPAPPPADILWRNIHVSGSSRATRRFLGLILLISISFVLTSSALLTDYILPTLFKVSNALDSQGLVSVSTAGFVVPLLSVLINSYILPHCIFHLARFTKHWKWSSFQKHALTQNSFLLFLNVMLLPAVGGLSIFSFYPNQDFAQTAIGQGSSFCIRYLLSATLLCSASQLVQLPKLGMRGLMLHLGRAVPVWKFDFGYWFAFVLSLLFLCLGYGPAIPILYPIGVVALGLKSLIDKYNFVVGIWECSNDSRGKVVHVAIRLVHWAVVYQLLICSIYGLVKVAQKLDVVNSFVKHETAKKNVVGELTLYSLLEHWYYVSLSLAGWSVRVAVDITKEPIGVLYMCIGLLGLGVLWLRVLCIAAPHDLVIQCLRRIFYRLRRIIYGTDYRYLKFAVHQDQKAVEGQVIKENISLSGLPTWLQDKIVYHSYHNPFGKFANQSRLPVSP